MIKESYEADLTPIGAVFIKVLLGLQLVYFSL